MLKAIAIKGYNELIGCTTYVGAVRTTTPYGSFTNKLMIDRTNQADALNDAQQEVELLRSISRHPDSQF